MSATEMTHYPAMHHHQQQGRRSSPAQQRIKYSSRQRLFLKQLQQETRHDASQSAKVLSCHKTTFVTRLKIRRKIILSHLNFYLKFILRRVLG